MLYHTPLEPSAKDSRKDTATFYARTVKLNKSSLMRRGGVKAVLVVLFAWMLLCIAYYYLPWSVRRHVHDSVPSVDRALQQSGYKLLQGWDELALIGRDAEVPLEKSARGEQAYAGFPSQGFQLFGRVKVLENAGYTVGYSETLRDPLWAAYRLFNVAELSSGKRPSRFSVDPRTKAQVAHDDYTNSGFDRGHMAPNYGIATRYGAAAQKETFLMSNIVPQTPYVNQHLWKDLEMRIAKRYGCYCSEVWIVTGPVFLGKIDKLPSGVAIPSHYYKIIADERNGRLRVLAFLVEQRCPPYTRIKTRLVSVDEIERLTGLDFFPDLSQSAQAELESRPATRLWPWIVPAIQYALQGRTD